MRATRSVTMISSFPRSDYAMEKGAFMASLLWVADAPRVVKPSMCGRLGTKKTAVSVDEGGSCRAKVQYQPIPGQQVVLH